MIEPEITMDARMVLARKIHDAVRDLNDVLNDASTAGLKVDLEIIERNMVSGETYSNVVGTVMDTLLRF